MKHALGLGKIPFSSLHIDLEARKNYELIKVRIVTCVHVLKDSEKFRAIPSILA